MTLFSLIGGESSVFCREIGRLEVGKLAYNGQVIRLLFSNGLLNLKPLDQKEIR